MAQDQNETELRNALSTANNYLREETRRKMQAGCKSAEITVTIVVFDGVPKHVETHSKERSSIRGN